MDENRNQQDPNPNQEQPLQEHEVPKHTNDDTCFEKENVKEPSNKKQSANDGEEECKRQTQQSPTGSYGNWQQQGKPPCTSPVKLWNVPPNNGQSPYRTNGQTSYGTREQPPYGTSDQTSYGTNDQPPYGTNSQPYWNQNLNGAPPPNWGNGGWQHGGGYPQPPNWPPYAESDNKMNVGVKIFIIVLAVLSVLCIVGFGVFGAFVVAHQKNISSNNDNGAASGSSQFSGKPDQNLVGDVPDRTDPNFKGITISPADGDMLTPEQVYQKASVSMVSVVSANSNPSSTAKVTQGSGVIATPDGYIITNAHVINFSKTTDVAVITSDQKQYKGVVVGFDQDADLAVVKIDAQDLPAATFGDANDLSVGETVIAIGNPGGVQYSGSMTMGVISAVNRSVENFSSTGVTYIQTDTAINPGNSGGGLINMRGQVVGINTIKVVSSGYEGMGFSIPVSQVKTIIDTLIRQGSIPAVGKLGIKGGTQFLPVSGQTYSVASGVLVASIDSDSPLIDTNLEKGDVITGFNGATITTLEDIYTQLKDYRVGQEVTLTVRRTKNDQDSTFEIQTKIMQRDNKSSTDS